MAYFRGLKLKLTRGPHEVWKKVLRAALKKWKNFNFEFSVKSQFTEKSIYWKMYTKHINIFKNLNILWGLRAALQLLAGRVFETPGLEETIFFSEQTVLLSTMYSMWSKLTKLNKISRSQPITHSFNTDMFLL